jgi:prevent-host-death family protein
VEEGPVEVGIRESKNHLSGYLAAVGQGDELVVTDRGEAVAEITPIGRARTIDRLIADGFEPSLLLLSHCSSHYSEPCSRRRARRDCCLGTSGVLLPCRPGCG